MCGRKLPGKAVTDPHRPIWIKLHELLQLKSTLKSPTANLKTTFIQSPSLFIVKTHVLYNSYGLDIKSFKILLTVIKAHTNQKANSPC